MSAEAGPAAEEPAPTVAQIWILGLAVAVTVAAMLRQAAPVWTGSADYAHGWIVPLLAGFLGWERWADRPDWAPIRAVPRAGLAVALALWWGGWLGGRLLLEPFPGWPAALWWLWSWGLAGLAGLITLAAGWRWARHFAAPPVFLFTALPWPTFVDLNVIGPLREALAAIAAAIMLAAGYPAESHGTVIQVGRELVGVDEACSGVRSLQAAIMVGFFLGELLRLGAGRRILLVVTGVALALAGNLGRTIFLVWRGAIDGAGGVAAWHDPAGAVQMVVTLGGLAGLAWTWGRGRPQATPATLSRFVLTTGSRAVAGGLIVLVLTTEAGVRRWFAEDSGTAAAAPLRLRLPVEKSSFVATPFTAPMQSLLKCDEHQTGRWVGEDGGLRAGYVLGWKRGHRARQAIALHRPEVCLPLSGLAWRADRGDVGPEDLPGAMEFRVTEFSQRGRPVFVFHSAWDIAAGRPLDEAKEAGLGAWLGHRLDVIRQPRRQGAAVVMAMAVYDAPDFAAAAQAFRREMSAIVRP